MTSEMKAGKGRARAWAAAAWAGLALLGGCATGRVERPIGWSPPQAVVAPSSFHGVHGLAIDAKGRLLAGSVVGNQIWEVDRQTGQARVFIDGPDGQADDLAIGPRGELAWTSYLMGMVRLRAGDEAPIQVIASGLPGINSLDFDRRNGKLYASQVFLGDALWELDPAGRQPPRLIAKDLGGLNGFEVGPDGMIYGPLWFKGQLVRIDPANGAVTVLNSEYRIPAAANLDGRGHLWAIDTNTGELSKVALATGQKTVVSRLKTSIDNLAIAPDGTVYVANMADNAIDVVDPASGASRRLTGGALAVPAGLKLDGDRLWVADIFAFREVDLRSGAVRDLARMQASDLEYPFAVGLSAKRLVLSSWFTGSVQLIDRDTRKTEAMWHGFKAPMDALPLDDGSVLVAEIGSGQLLRVHGERGDTREVLAQGLAGPVQMVRSREGGVYLTEAAGTLVHIDPATGARRVIASGLALPEGLAETPWGTVVVAESAARRLTEIDPASGQQRLVAAGLPIGLPPGPGLPPPYVVTGVAVAPDGSVYFSSDLHNALYRLAPQR